MLATTIIRRNDNIIAAAIAHETVLLNADNWTYAQFNETASRIWESLDEPRSVADIVAALLAEYAVDELVCRREVQDFAQDMSGRGFIIAEDPD
jgi:hypothetical protein